MEAADQTSVVHPGSPAPGVEARRVPRHAREEVEDQALAAGATRAVEAGHRLRPEEPDPFRTCFERDRDRILHSTAFRRLAGKTQVFVFPRDHERTRLTHALEVAQVATAVSRAVGLNVALTEAIALGHDCGHGPGGHASEEAFNPYLAEGYHHAIWGAEVVLAPLNLCQETVDGIRNHSWNLPSASTPEGAVVSWADRCAYCAHDLEDALSAGIVQPGEVPAEVGEVLGRSRSAQLRALIAALVDCIVETGTIAMWPGQADALGALRAFNYERIYFREASLAQAKAVIDVLRALVDHFAENPRRIPGGDLGWSPLHPLAADLDPDERFRRAVTYVGGMTDRYAFETAVELLDYPRERLPRSQ